MNKQIKNVEFNVNEIQELTDTQIETISGGAVPEEDLSCNPVYDPETRELLPADHYPRRNY